MVFSLSPEALAKAKEIGSRLSVEIEKDSLKGTMKVTIMPKDDMIKAEIPRMLDGMVDQLCDQFYAWLGIKVKVIEFE